MVDTRFSHPLDIFSYLFYTNHDLSVWYLSFYCDPRLTEIVVVKILMEGIATSAGLYAGLFIFRGVDKYSGVKV